MFEPEVFLKQMYHIEESTYDIVATFRRPGIRAPLPLFLPMLRLATIAICRVHNTSSHVLQNWRK